MPASELIAAIREFTGTITNPYDLQELLQRLTGRAMAVTSSQGVGVMLEGDDGLGFAAASSDEVVEMEVLQDRIETGACYTAFERSELVVVDDLAEDDRWPTYRERALELGFRSVVGVPMTAFGRTIGVLNLYRRQPGPWRDDHIDAAEIVTAMGAGYVVHANEMRAQHELTSQLRTALESRDLIGQAKGVLMARHGVGSEEAFGMLRALSQHHNIKLRDVARRLVDTEGADVPR